MAAVTVTTGYPKHNVNGSSRELYYRIAIAADADHLDVPMRDVEDVQFRSDVDTEGIGIASIAAQGFGSRITFDTASSVTTAYGRVTGK